MSKKSKQKKQLSNFIVEPNIITGDVRNLEALTYINVINEKCPMCGNKGYIKLCDNNIRECLTCKAKWEFIPQQVKKLLSRPNPLDIKGDIADLPVKLKYIHKKGFKEQEEQQ